MKAPPSHTFLECTENEVVDRFEDSGKKLQQGSDSKISSSKNVPDLLKWISDLTIKRRKFRRRYRCSHLLAEAVLSNTLRNARQELAVKQEEKRKKAHEFSYQLSIKFSKLEEEKEQEIKVDVNNNEQRLKDNSINQQDQTSQLANGCSMEVGSNDEHIQACISSLDNFFSELKSIKV